MRVGINVAILSTRRTGVGQYVHALVQALPRVGKDIEWVFLGVDPAVDGIPRYENVRTVEVRGLRGLRRVTWEQTMLPHLARRAGVELLHCPDFSRPMVNTVPVINTIHDLSYYAPESFFSPIKRTYKQAMARVAIQRSMGIVADSEFTRQEIFRRFRIDEERVFVAYLGVEPVPNVPKREVDRPFLLFVSTLENRKNLVTLVRAFAKLRSSGRVPHWLILAGQPGWGWGKIRTAINESGVGSDVYVPGYLGRDQILQLYRSADLFVYPSVYEGFGLPVLEAMACGTPVVCSRAASLPEVAGDAAEYFDALSAEDMAAAILRVLESTERQAELRRKGLHRAKQFTWEDCARKHVEVYRHLLGKA